MPTDYDAPRTREDGASEHIDTPIPRRSQSPGGDLDDGDIVESYELPGADLSGEEFSATVVPRQDGEFVCMGCFLVHHRSQAGKVNDDGTMLCTDCVG
ncbi:DUF4193 domain-containing protein [Tomitella cavernea]|uniref:DUF4193 domain-containing protein n=1 Tax=Tomitella cavernea TaxID=1387982 RepID=A0ABP9D1D4_9ACTN|nr:DUF4193 domain-containing protein [Tomitella cavernea]